MVEASPLEGGPGSACFCPLSPGKSGQQTVRSVVQEGHSYNTRMTQHAVVLGPSQSVVPSTHVFSTSQIW